MKRGRIITPSPIRSLMDCGKLFYERQWMWGMAGNLSMRIKSDPLEYLITPSGVNKGRLKASDFIKVVTPASAFDVIPASRRPGSIASVKRMMDSPPTTAGNDEKKATQGNDGNPHRPSSETVIHEAIYRAVPRANVVFHVHPLYSTVVSAFHGDSRRTAMLDVGWFEMMKGLGAEDEESAEIAIVPNWQDGARIAQDMTEYIRTARKVLPAVLVYNHGVTVWAESAEQARNYLEIVEYVCQYLYLKHIARPAH
jgi:methylthioribulose-1-phosphate dehydratase